MPMFWSVLRRRMSASWPVSRVLSTGFLPLDNHSSRTSVTGRFMQPTRAASRKQLRHLAMSCHPYLVLLLVGFTLPLPLPVARCALTAPFHPCRHKSGGMFLWHFPWGCPRRTLSGTVFSWSPDFPPSRPLRDMRQRLSSQLAVKK
jgi:hypothetical protein